MGTKEKNFISCGRNLEDIGVLRECVNELLAENFDFVCAPITKFRHCDHLSKWKPNDRQPFIDINELYVNPEDWGTLIVGKLPDWLDLDASVDDLRRKSEVVLNQELQYASFIGLPALLFELKSDQSVNLARNISNFLQESYCRMLFWVKVPLSLPSQVNGDSMDEDEDEDTVDKDFTELTVSEDHAYLKDNEDDKTWHWWNKFRLYCNSNKCIGVVLELTADLPDIKTTRRWLAEPIKAIEIPTSVFVTNAKGYPVLSRKHQEFVFQFFRLKSQIILSGSSLHEGKTIQTYWQYLNHLWQNQPGLDPVSLFAKGYEDCLQTPLQPLSDNLESATYEVFEKDPIKYPQYQEAVKLALIDMAERASNVPYGDQNRIFVIMVVGAGRGPLVTGSLNAAKEAGVSVKIYAVEKNYNAISILQNKKQTVWATSDVTIVSCDMREFDPKEKADILVSELLGSFGDNELSPECLDGAQRFLKRDGISIPSKYTSYLAPLQSMKLHNVVIECAEKYKPPEYPFEMPYVVRMHNYCLIDEAKPAFTFRHPNWDLASNDRYEKLSFTSQSDMILHGFAGYFDAVLYKDVTISIVPQTHSPGMFSWFSVLFPLKNPVPLKAEDKIELHIWRASNSKNVWYEWMLVSPSVSHLHNSMGRSYLIGL